MNSSRPTIKTAQWAIKGFRDATVELLRVDRSTMELRLYFYAVTLSGWSVLEGNVALWKAAVQGRLVTAYVGTDHGLTEPAALERMINAGVVVRVMRRYNGVYHPKVLWFAGEAVNYVLAGSNNLTFDGLSANIEFATLVEFNGYDADLGQWHACVHSASDVADPAMIKSYKVERDIYRKERADTKLKWTFTWGGRAAAPTGAAGAGALAVTVGPAPRSGDYISEIMPRETGTEGSQIQVPQAAATAYFRVPVGANASIVVNMTNKGTGEARDVTMRRYKNATTRMSLHEIDYGERPCVVVISRTGRRRYDFEVVKECVDPARYRYLLSLCRQKRPNRRWKVV